MLLMLGVLNQKQPQEILNYWATPDQHWTSLSHLKTFTTILGYFFYIFRRPHKWIQKQGKTGLFVAN